MINLIFIFLQFIPSIFIVSPDGIQLASMAAVVEAPSIYVTINSTIGDSAFQKCIMLNPNSGSLVCESQRALANKADADIRFQNAIRAILNGTPIIQAFKTFGVFIVIPAPTTIITPFGPEPIVPVSPSSPVNPFPGEQ